MIKVRQRAAIVTADTTYKGHFFVFDEYTDGNIATCENIEDVELRRLTDASYESRDGTVFRIVGTNADGEQEIWRAVAQCPRCASPAIYATPAYDVPV